jgi:hypothetical protein
VLHYRWFWMLLALLAALYLLTRPDPAEAGPGEVQAGALPGAGLVPVVPRVR